MAATLGGKVGGEPSGEPPTRLVQRQTLGNSSRFGAMSNRKAKWRPATTWNKRGRHIEIRAPLEGWVRSRVAYSVRARRSG